MPFKTYTTKADFDADYDVGAERNGHPNTRSEVRLHYCRAVLYPVVQQRAKGIVQAMGWTAPGPVLVVVGAGFSWLAEVLETEYGFTRVVGIDTSPYIQSDKNNDEAPDYDAAITAVGLNPSTGEGASVKTGLVARAGGAGPRCRASRGVLNQDGNTQQSRNAIRSALGLSGNNQPDWLLSELVLDALTDADFLNLSTRLRAWVPNVAHYTTTNDGSHVVDGTWNAHTLEEWKALQPLDVFIDKVTFRKL